MTHTGIMAKMLCNRYKFHDLFMKKISSRTIARALLYLRTLETLIRDGKDTVSSRELARITGLTDVQIRKDISNFGKVGTPGVGYNVAELKKVLEDIVLAKKVIRMALFGAGHLGTAILKYPAFGKQKLRIVAAFDRDKRKIGRTINGVKVYPVEKAPEIIRKNRVDIGIIAVPPESGQKVADLMVLSGLKAIVNFAPVSLNVPGAVSVRDIDLSIEFLSVYCDTQK